MNEPALNEVLDAMAVGVAMVDREGYIRYANASWQCMVNEIACFGPEVTPWGSVGANYLDAFVARAGLLADSELSVRAHIQAVLGGERDEYTLEYPCQAPQQRRWFTMTVRPLGPAACKGAVITLFEVTSIKQVEEELRIAAIAFDSQEGMLVLDGQRRILRVNQAFTRITGFSAQEVQGKHSGSSRSMRHPHAFYEGIWRQVAEQGTWHGTVWNRRKNGEDYLSNTSITALRDAQGRVTHYVGNFTDVTTQEEREQERLRREAEHRGVLVREVHHRIKNNLQGVIGILRDYGDENPKAQDAIGKVVAKVQSIAVIHGLQGRTLTDQVRVCELTTAVAESVSTLWRTKVEVIIPAVWQPCVISKDEAVPLALVLNELMINAVKHGGGDQEPVRVRLNTREMPCALRISIRNSGQWAPQPGGRRVGLELVEALLPREGAHLSRREGLGCVDTLLDLSAPVISMELVN